MECKLSKNLFLKSGCLSGIHSERFTENLLEPEFTRAIWQKRDFLEWTGKLCFCLHFLEDGQNGCSDNERQAVCCCGGGEIAQISFATVDFHVQVSEGRIGLFHLLFDFSTASRFNWAVPHVDFGVQVPHHDFLQNTSRHAWVSSAKSLVSENCFRCLRLGSKTFVIMGKETFKNDDKHKKLCEYATWGLIGRGRLRQKNAQPLSCPTTVLKTNTKEFFQINWIFGLGGQIGIVETGDEFFFRTTNQVGIRIKRDPVLFPLNLVSGKWKVI